MSLLLYGPVNPAADVPDFGEELHLHMQKKAHPDVSASSRTAWGLLAKGLKMMNVSPLPRVAFDKNGKPRFADHPLHFSLSHSSGMAAALISDFPCGVDIERIREEISQRLIDRCLNEEEKHLGCDFFEIWTKKECIAKLDGSGMRSRPREMNTLEPVYQARFVCMRISDEQGGSYFLTALCKNAQETRIVRMSVPEKK